MPDLTPITPDDGQNLTKKCVRIVLVEDHIILRDGLRSLLDLESDFLVVGEADSYDKCLEIVRATKPDLVITDIGLHGQSGITLLPELKKIDARLKVLILTAHCTDEFVRAALGHGADGYVLKDASRHELISGIRAIMDGHQFLGAEVKSQIVSAFVDGKERDKLDSAAKITPRETEVMVLIASAYTTKGIARELDISVKTVEKHRSNMMRKLGLRSTAAVTLYAVRNNYLAIDTDANPEAEV